MRPPPPGDETVGIAVPALLLEEGGNHFRQPGLHVDDGAILVEDENLGLPSEVLPGFHPSSLVLSAITIRVNGGGDSI